MTARVHAGVERVLAQTAGHPIRVVSTEQLGSEWAQVARLTLDAPLEGAGPTVVLKTRRVGQTGWGFDFFNLRSERATLQTLAALGVEVAPRFIAGDDDAGILVMTDLGAGPTVGRLLSAADSAIATRGLEALGRTVGRLHAATLSRAAYDEYYARRAALGPVDPEWDRRSTFTSPMNKWPRLSEHMTAFGYPDGAQAAPEVATLFDELTAPGPLIALSLLDLTPMNAVMAGPDETRLIDFESAGFRHLALDAAVLRFPFPHYGYWAVMPEEPRRQMEVAYRAEVGAAWPGAANDAEYNRIIAAGCAVWAINRTSRLARIEEANEESWRRRVQIVHTIKTFVGAAREASVFPQLADWFAHLVHVMRARWPEANDPPPAFPAFATSL